MTNKSNYIQISDKISLKEFGKEELTKQLWKIMFQSATESLKTKTPIYQHCTLDGKSVSHRGSVQFSSVQSLSHVRLCNPINRSTPGLPVHHQLLEFIQTHVHRVSDAIQPTHPLSSLSPPALNLSQHQGLFNESALCISWPKYWSFSFNISPSNEHPGMTSFRMDWMDLLAVQGTLKSLLQHHSSKASILRCSAFFMVQLSHPYMTTGKTIALSRQTLVGKVLSLLFNMLSWS